MADERVEAESPRRERPAKAAERRSNRKPPSREQLAARARRQLAEITGMEPANVTAMERREEGGWKLTVELVELARVPRAADVLGVYDVRLNAAGKLLEYRRVRRYSRGETGSLAGG